VSDKFSFNKQIDLNEYDRIVLSSPQGTIFSSSFFLKSLKVNYQLWNIKQGSEIKAVVCLITSKDNKNIILNDYVIYGGLIFNTDTKRLVTKRRSDEFKISEFVIEKLIKKYKKIEIQFAPEYLDIRPFQWLNYNQKVKKKFNLETKFTSYIDFKNQNLNDFLNTELYKNMETVRRYDYRMAIKEGAKISTTQNSTPFFKFYDEVLKKQENMTTLKNLSNLKNLISNLIESNRGKIFYVEDKLGNILYALFYIWDNKKAYYFLGAGNPKINKSWQSIFGHCEIFKYIKENYGITRIDLEGVNSPKRGWFKLSLGGTLNSYYRVELK